MIYSSDTLVATATMRLTVKAINDELRGQPLAAQNQNPKNTARHKANVEVVRYLLVDRVCFTLRSQQHSSNRSRAQRCAAIDLAAFVQSRRAGLLHISVEPIILLLRYGAL